MTQVFILPLLRELLRKFHIIFEQFIWKIGYVFFLYKEVFWIFFFSFKKHTTLEFLNANCNDEILGDDLFYSFFCLLFRCIIKFTESCVRSMGNWELYCCTLLKEKRPRPSLSSSSPPQPHRTGQLFGWVGAKPIHYF